MASTSTINSRRGEVLSLRQVIDLLDADDSDFGAEPDSDSNSDSYSFLECRTQCKTPKSYNIKCKFYNMTCY